MSDRLITLEEKLMYVEHDVAELSSMVHELYHRISNLETRLDAVHHDAIKRISALHQVDNETPQDVDPT